RLFLPQCPTKVCPSMEEPKVNRFMVVCLVKHLRPGTGVKQSASGWSHSHWKQRMEFAKARNLHLPSRQELDDTRTVNRSRSRGCLQQAPLSRRCRSKPDCRFAATSVAP